MTQEGSIGRFIVRKLLGRGGTGDVSLAYDPEMGQEVALKVIHVGIEPERLEAEKRGARIQQQLSLDVPQIARVYDIGEDGDLFFIAMEYVRGNDLSDLLRAGPLSEPRAVSFAIQLCEILEGCSRVALSAEGSRNQTIVHGDIKPQNIRIEEGDRVRLLDFGVAKSVSLTRPYTGNVFGSLPYVSPERLNDARVSVQSDLWSVGVVLYQMVTGELPYPMDSEEILRAHILRGGLPQALPTRLRTPLRQILARCLEVDPDRRYPEAAELRDKLEGLEPAVSNGAEETRRTFEGLAAEEPTLVGPAGKKARPRLWARFFRAKRSELRQLQARLSHLRSFVPSHAHRFHKMVEELDGELEKIASGWRLWIGRDLLERLRDRITRLSEVSEPLRAAIREAEQIVKEVRLLHPGIQALAEPRTRRSLQSLSHGWTTDLQKVGVDVFRQSDLDMERDQVKAIRDDVRLYAQVLSLLDEVERALSVLGFTAQTAALSAGMVALHEELREKGPSDDWLQRVQALVQPLREAMRQAKDPVQELRRLFRSVTELQSWAQILGDLKPEAEGLERRYRSLVSTPKMSDVEALDRDSAELRDQLIQRAQGLRDGRLAELEGKVTTLVSVCGPQPDLEERLRSLRRKPFEGPPSLPEWTRQYEELGEHYRSTLKNQEKELEQGLAQAVGRLHEKLEALRGQPLSAAAQQEALSLGDEIRELERRPTGAGESLRRLGRCGDIADRIEQLRQRIRDDLQELFRQQQVLRELNDDLQIQARQAHIDIPDLSQRIDEFDEGANAPSLERARQLADSLAADLDGLRRHFEEQCRKVLKEQAAEMREIAAALRQIGSPLSNSSLPDLASGSPPQEAAQAVVAGVKRVQHAREVAYQAFSAQEVRLQEARSVLRLDHREELGLDEREEAAKVLAEIEEDLANGEANKIARLERRERLIEACEPLLSHLHQDERTARERLALLRERLQRQTKQDLRRFCPREIADRVADLVYGIRLKPWPGQAVQAQLAEAERLLTLVEAQTMRRAAAELDQAVRDLTAGSFERAEVDLLLGELTQSQEALPPSGLRRKILAMHERQWQAQGGGA
jgi:serine/threonine protein kinase